MVGNKKHRIGIYSGSFDPVHKGHVGFALDALNDANLDAVYFLVESRPRHKPGITHAAHRIAMLQLATRAHANLRVLELPDKQFSVAKTLPRIQAKFKGDDLVMLMGSDVFEHVASWPLAKELLAHVGLAVGLRSNADLHHILELATSLPKPLIELNIIESNKPEATSKQIRQLYRSGESSKMVLPSVSRYIKKHWLYAAVN